MSEQKRLDEPDLLDSYHALQEDFKILADLLAEAREKLKWSNTLDDSSKHSALIDRIDDALGPQKEEG